MYREELRGSSGTPLRLAAPTRNTPGVAQHLRVLSLEDAVLSRGEFYHYQIEGLRVRTTAGETWDACARCCRRARTTSVVRGRGEVLIGARDVIVGVDLMLASLPPCRGLR